MQPSMLEPEVIRHPLELLQKEPSKLSSNEAAYLLYLIRKARTDFATFCFCVYPGYQFPRHLKVLTKVLTEIEHTPDARTMVTCPPRHGKSLTTSVLFPAWWLGRNPTKQIITASYSSGLTGSFASQVKGIMLGSMYQMIFPEVKPAGRAAAHWRIAKHGGGIFATGVTSSITGFGADMMIIDDPIRDAMFADSPSWREKVWDWYTQTAYTRLHPGAALFVIATRWHHDDLSGRLLVQAQQVGEIDEETGEEYQGDVWDEIYFPAIDKDEHGKDTIALWPERYGLTALRRIRASIGSRAWNALYQGKPTPDEGMMVQRAWFRKVISAAPAEGVKWVRYWDKAGTEDAGDWTVGVLMGMDKEKRFYIADVIRGQWTSLTREEVIEQVAHQDRAMHGNVVVWQEQEPGSGGKFQAEETKRRLAGFSVRNDRPSGTLALRADPLATQAEAGNIYMVAGRWIGPFVQELCEFPLGSHDDQIAAAAGALFALTGKRSFKLDFL